jgi:hypothetical protein
MALGFYFTPRDFTPDRYDEAIRQLETSGAGAPEGRTLHIALERDGLVQVFDVWESKEALEAFGPTLTPILEGLGVDAGQPMVQEVRNIIRG